MGLLGNNDEESTSDINFNDGVEAAAKLAERSGVGYLATGIRALKRPALTMGNFLREQETTETLRDRGLCGVFFDHEEVRRICVKNRNHHDGHSGYVATASIMDEIKGGV